jgi:alpha-D-ribose 1-methylphosphonate 5-triphosphate synthase subunit PhnH
MDLSLDTATLSAGFADPVFDSQQVFRGILNAIAYPGRIHRLARLPAIPDALSPAMAAVALTLCDFETPLWLDRRAATPAAQSYVKFHCSVPFAEDPAKARFAMNSDAAAMPRLAAFAIGEDQYPDRSATLVIEVPALEGGPVRRWAGPGIPRRLSVGVAGLPAWFWDDWALNNGLYPMGVDVIFTCGDAVMGLPRGISVEA